MSQAILLYSIIFFPCCAVQVDNRLVAEWSEDSSSSRKRLVRNQPRNVPAGEPAPEVPRSKSTHIHAWRNEVGASAEANSAQQLPKAKIASPSSALQHFAVSFGAGIRRGRWDMASPASIRATNSSMLPSLVMQGKDMGGFPRGQQSSLGQFQTVPVGSDGLLSSHSGNAMKTTSNASNVTPSGDAPALTRTVLILVVATGLISLGGLLATFFSLRRPTVDVAVVDSPEEPVEGTITSIAQIWGITSVNFAYGVVVCQMGVFLMPKESQAMFPGHPSIALGAFEVLVSCSMLVGPFAGRISDSLKHPMGRRRPIVHIALQVAGALTVGMWAASLLEMRAVFLVLLLVQQMMWNAVNSAQTALLADLVDPSRKDVASAIQTASLLAGAIVSIVIFQGFAMDAVDFRWNYFFLIIISWLMLPLMHLASPEQPSELMSLPPALDLCRPREALAEVFYLGDLRSPDFALVTRERAVYYCAVASKAFLFFFIKDGIGIHNDKDQAVFMGEVALSSSCCAALAGLITSLIFSVGRMRPQVVACFGAFLMAFASQFWGAIYADGVDMRKTVMLIFTAGYGTGQGAYLAADLALAIKTMPDPNEASRYMGLWGLSAFVGGGLGSIGAATLMEVFGRLLPEKMGLHIAHGAYHAYGYMALLFCTFICDSYVALICLFIRTREEYNNPQGGQDVELNPQDAS